MTDSIVNLVFKVAQSEHKNSIRALEELTKKALGLEEQNTEAGESALFIAQKLQELQGKAQIFGQLAEEAKAIAVNGDNAADALSNAARVSKGFKAAQEEVKKTRLELEQYIDSLQTAQVETQKLSREDRLDLADNELDQLNRRVGFGGDVQSNLGSLRGLAGTAGATGLASGLGVAGELAALAEELPRLKFAAQNMGDVIKLVATQIGFSGAGLIGALIGLGLALKVASDQSQEAREEVSQYFATQQELNEFLATAGQEDVERRIAETEASLAIAQANLEQVEATRDKVKSAIDDLENDDSGNAIARFGKDIIGNLGSGVLEGIGDISGGLFFGTFEELETQLDTSADKVSTLESELELLNAARTDETVLINQAALELEKQKNFQATALERQRQFQIDNLALIESANSEQLSERIAAIENERLATVALLNTLFTIPEPTAEITASIEGYKQQLVDLNVEQQNLTFSVIPLIEAREDETAAIEAQQAAMKDHVADLREQANIELEFTKFQRTATTDSIAQRIQDLEDEKAALESMLPELERLAPTSDDAAKALEDTNDRIQAINADLARTGGAGVSAARLNEERELAADLQSIEEDSAARILAIRQQTAQKEADLLKQLSAGLEDADRKAAEDRASAAEDYQDSLAEIERDGAQEREDILEQFSRSTNQAVKDRDAVAYKNAESKRDDDLSDLAQNLARQREELAQGYAEQLQDIQQALDRQRSSLQQRYQQQLFDLQQAQAQQIAAERSNAAQALAARQSAYQQELAQLQSFSTGGVTLITGFATGALQQLALFATNAQQIIASINGSVAAGIGGLSGQATGVSRTAAITEIVQQEVDRIFSGVF